MPLATTTATTMRYSLLLGCLLLSLNQQKTVGAFSILTSSSKTRPTLSFPSGYLISSSSALFAEKQQQNDDQMGTEKDMNPFTKASWYAVEAFGKVFGSAKQESTASSADVTEPPSSLQETLDRIQLDNDRSYFLSGEVDKLIYDESCTFADPFVSFDGRDRFVDNLANLGSFITQYSAKLLDYEQPSPEIVRTRLMVKLELNLPWKPVLAWPWGVEYTIDTETNLITKHVESWDIEAIEGVKQIFRKPTTTF